MERRKKKRENCPFIPFLYLSPFSFTSVCYGDVNRVSWSNDIHVLFL
jgi:hypothetical protein